MGGGYSGSHLMETRRKEDNKLAERRFREQNRKKLQEHEGNAQKLEQNASGNFAKTEQRGTQNEQLGREFEDQQEPASAASFNKPQNLPLPRALLTESDNYDPSSNSTEPGLKDKKKNYVFVDEHTHHPRLKAMRACEGCRRRKIKCDAATTNQRPCMACVRLKLHCVPPVSETNAVQDDPMQFQAYPSSINNKVKEIVPLTTPGILAGISLAFGSAAIGMSPMKLVSYKEKDSGQNYRNYFITNQAPVLMNYSFIESARGSSRDSMEQRGHDLIVEGKNQLLTPEEDTKENAACVIEKKVAAEALKTSDQAYRLEKTSGHVRHHSSDMKIEESEEETEGFLKSQNAVSGEVNNNFVLTLNALAVLSLIFAISIANADDISFVICLHWLHCASRIAQVYCQGLGGLNRSWIKDPVSNNSEHDEFNEAISLILSECAAGVSLLYGWSLLPTLLLGCTSFFSTSFSSTGSEHQTTIRRFGRPWNALWCFLGWSLMVFRIPQTTIITPKGMVTILPKSRRRALDQFGYLLGDLQWSDVDPMSAGRSPKLRCEQLSQVLNMQPQSFGKRRVRGQCRCGYRFVDEFTEVRPAAAAYYENLLQKRSSHSKDYPSPANPDQGIQDANDAEDTNAQSKRSTAMSSIAGGLITFIIFAFSLLGKRRNGPTLPQHQLETGGNQPQRSSICHNELLFLLLCIPQHQFATRLLQPQISDITSDQAFFVLLRRNYRQVRGRMRRIFSMRTIRSIKFVQFEMYKSELVDIRKLDDLPPEDKTNEYRYNPIPADIIPPVGENHMLHLINHPNHAEADGFVLDRIPKKLKERLLVPPSCGTGLGWGIYFIEGWHVGVITLVAFTALLAGSLVFLVCWSVLEHDLQGASGVAAYMVAFLGLAIGSIQAVFELT